MPREHGQCATQRHAELSDPPISLNAAINLLAAVGAQVPDPSRLAEVRTLIEKLRKRLDRLDNDW